MTRSSFALDGASVMLYAEERPELLFLQPVDARDAALLDREIAALGEVPRPFALAAFQVSDWNRDLSPWEATPAFGKIPFGGRAEATLAFLTDRLLPELRQRLALPEDAALCLGGYSLAGLFALWAATRTDLFSAVAAASPSVWFPGWLEEARAHPIQAPVVYLSLGDREERTKNPLMATVGDCIRELHALLRVDHRVILEWNAGNHFQDPELRTARAFSRVAEEMRNG